MYKVWRIAVSRLLFFQRVHCMLPWWEQVSWKNRIGLMLAWNTGLFFRFFLWKLMISSFLSLIAEISSSVVVNCNISSTLQSSIRHSSLRVLEVIGSPCPILLSVLLLIPQWYISWYFVIPLSFMVAHSGSYEIMRIPSFPVRVPNVYMFILVSM